MSAPRFSVILISFNQERYVEEAVRSVLNSSYKDLELLCVDDGSSDGTVRKLHELAQHDPRMVVVENVHSGKPAIARNTGVAKATGDYLCFLDGDDVAHVDRLRYFDCALNAYSGAVDVVFGDYKDFADGTPPEDGKAGIIGTPRQKAIASFALAHTGPDPACLVLDVDALVDWLMSTAFVVNTNTLCVRRQLFPERGLAFPTERTIGEDNIVWLQCLVDSRVAFVDRVVAYWRKHPSSLTARRSPSFQREMVESLRCELAFVEPRLGAIARVKARQRLFHHAFDVPWLLEQEGRWLSAALEYSRVAVEFRSLAALMGVVKAPFRRLANILTT